MTDLEAQIGEYEAKLEEAQELLEQEQNFHREIQENIATRQQEKSAYFEKIGFQALFSGSEEEKEDWLKNALKETDSLITSKQSLLNEYQQQMDQLKISDMKAAIDQHEEEIEDLKKMHRSNGYYSFLVLDN